jgi:alpha-galactosidase
MSVRWIDLDYPASLAADVRDLWSGQVSRGVTNAFSAEVASHGVVMVRIEAAT